MNNILELIKNIDFDVLFGKLNKMNESEKINTIIIILNNNYEDFLNLLRKKFLELNDLRKKQILLNKNFYEIYKMINNYREIDKDFFNNLFENKKYLYEVLNFYILKGISPISSLSFYSQIDFNLFKNNLSDLFNYNVDISLIEYLMNMNEYHNLNYLYYVNINYPNIFRYDIKNIFGQEFICGIVYNQENIHSYSINDLRIIYKIYLNLNDSLYNEKAFLLSFSIYDKLANLVNWKNLKKDFSDILKKYYSLVYHNKDFLLDQEFIINKVNSIDDINDLKKYLINLFLLREEYFKYCDFNIFNKIDISESDCNYKIILMIKSLFNNNIDEIKKNANILINDNDIYIKIIKLSLTMPRYYETELNKNLLKVDKKVDVHILDGQEFNLLVHILNAYGNGGDYLNMNNIHGSRQICLSSITDFSMGFVDFPIKYKCPKIILGFNHIENDSLLSISSYDSGSRYDGYHYCNRSMYFTDIRTNTLLTCYYNEYSIKRSNKLKPDYIVCFNDISSDSITAAKDLSLPIILIDEKKYIEKNRAILDDLYKKAINGNTNSISIYLFRMIQYYYTFGYRNNISDESRNIINSLKSVVKNLNNVKKTSLLELLFSINELIVSEQLPDKIKNLELIKKL